MKVQFLAQIKSLIGDFQSFRQNKAAFNVWLAVRHSNQENSAALEKNLAERQGQVFGTRPGQAYLVCECSNDVCMFGDFVDQEQMMDILTADPKVTFIHKFCETVEPNGWSAVFGEIGNFYIVKK